MNSIQRAARAICLEIGLTAAIAFAIPAGNALALDCEEPVATVISAQGAIEAKSAAGSEWTAVRLDTQLCAGDVVRAGANSRADLQLQNQSVLRLRAGSEITLQGVTEAETSVVDLLKGAAHFFSRKGPRNLEVNTPFTVAGVRGTEFYLAVEDDRTLISVFEGQVYAANEAGDLTISGGESGVAEAGKAPRPVVVARPRDAVTWTLHYLPVVHVGTADFAGDGGWQSSARASLTHYRGGDIEKAFESLAGTEDVRDPGLRAYRASLHLSVGNVDAARADVEGALAADPNDADALALQTVIALAQNDDALAAQSARKAVGAHPDSASAQLALSYAQQSAFDLEASMKSAAEATRLEPANALAWARLAELQSSLGKSKQALASAEKAQALDPSVSRSQTVLGFARLTRTDTAGARAAFQAAIELDSADPLPRLGLGLAKIREGDLTAGGREIEAAASLDPSNSLIRSYLGKTYFEEKRSGLDEREYAMAKELDPNDPTPWFYDAIAKQTTNRPVAALKDIQQAIALNDNRGVYRSRLLLDSDLAARSAGLARIYSDLGFQQLALVEGWHSTNTDPTNHSAHRLLADSYAALPRHEIARVSELLRSQLLQPINTTPIQPGLAESTSIVSSAGPATQSFTEFSPMFNRNGHTVLATGMLGENNPTQGDEVVVAGIRDKLSYSAGYRRFETDGFRRNADQENHLVDGFVQYEISPETSIQGEYRYQNDKKGDRILRFFEDQFLPGQNRKDEVHTGRFGIRHNLAPNSILLGSVIYQERDFDIADTDPAGLPTLARVETEPSAVSGEAQHLYRGNHFNVTSGGGYFDIDRDDDQFVCCLPSPPFPPGAPLVNQKLDLDVGHINLYQYGDLDLGFLTAGTVFEDLTLTAGWSVDLLDPDDSNAPDPDVFNPKAGVTWRPLPDTTVRAAAFRVLKRSLITQQTLEPTQVAGFNQFFDDPGGTKAWRYGFAVDQKLSDSVFGGVELSMREVKAIVNNSRTDSDDEYLARTYLFWAPFDWLSARAEYSYEELKHDQSAMAYGFRNLETHHGLVGLNYFHPCGFSAGVTTSYYHQRGNFSRVNQLTGASTFQRGDDGFALVDATLSYRLPDRHGFVSVGVTNLFDEDFEFNDTDLNNPSIQPDRQVFGRLTLTFP